MIITLSPAKLMDFATSPTIKEHTTPQFSKNAKYLNDLLKDLSASQIKDMMSINPKQAHQVYQYIQSYNMERTPQKQAALVYNGIAYSGLVAETFAKEDWAFAQNHLIILSGLYGALRPMDLIKPYRLEAQIKLENEKGKNLYAYWTDTITEYFTKRLEADDNIWINLSSQEYTKVINKKALPEGTTIVTPIFKQDTEKGYKQIVVYAKKARGMMSRFIIQNRIKKVEDLKHFDAEGYSFAPDLSKGEEWIFIR